MTVAVRPTDAAVAPASDKGRAIVALVCVGIFMTTLDTSIVNIGLPSIARAFHAPLTGTIEWVIICYLVVVASLLLASIVNIGLPSIARAFHAPLTGTIEWVIICYLVVVASLLLTFGRLSDMVGRTPIWTAGLVLFTVGSGICGAAPSLALLILARAVQGAGAALILTTSTAILTDAVPQEQRGRALGWSAAAISVGFSAGPTVGGLLTEYLSWRWIFYVNVPIALGAIIATRRVLPRSGGKRSDERFDPIGALLLGLGVATLCLGLSFGASWGWTSPLFLGSIALSLALLVGAVFNERHVADPLIDLGLFRLPHFGAALVSLILSMMAVFAVNFLMPFYFEELRGLSTARSGLLLTPFSLSMSSVDYRLLDQGCF